MKLKINIILTIVLTIIIQDLYAVEDALNISFDKHATFQTNQSFIFNYRTITEKFSHGKVPWTTMNFDTKGEITISEDNTYLLDTMKFGRNESISKTFFSKDFLAMQEVDQSEMLLYDQTKNFIEVNRASSYSCMPILIFFIQQKNDIVKFENNDYYIYLINKKEFSFKIFINKSNYFIEIFESVTHNPMYGDWSEIKRYSSFKNMDKIIYPSSISVETLGGKLKSQISITNGFTKFSKQLIDFNKLKSFVKPEVILEVEKYKQNITLVNFKNIGVRSLIFDLGKELLIAEAPLNPENAELLILEAKKIYPEKKIKYFVFGHHHPDYVGGIKAFANIGASILVAANNLDYAKYLVNAKRTYTDKKLEFKESPVFEIIDKKFELGSGEYRLEIYNIGLKSKHTEDYFIYYFPEQKIIFEDDLAKISNLGKNSFPTERQIGLYNALIDLDLNVNTIIQSWPTLPISNIKTVFSFEELRKSVETTIIH